MNDQERAQWVDNDEGLYRLKGRMSMRKFIRENRALIDEVIERVTKGSKPAHYLAYGWMSPGEEKGP